MRKISSKKLTLLAIISSYLVLQGNSAELAQVYTIEQAQQCFHSQALAACQQNINECLTEKQCQRQLQFYHDCNFQKQTNNQVFNGNCFKDWKQTAVASKKVIDCLDSQCNLAGYNSQVSLNVLYTCTAEALITHKINCDQQCQSILQKEVSKKIQYQPINEVYSNLQKGDGIKNENVRNLINVIRKQCLDEQGAIKKRHEQQNDKKKRNKQRLIERMNEKNKDEEYLRQYDDKNGSKLGPEEL